MAQLNTLIFQQNFSATDTILVTHIANSKFVNVKVIIANQYRSDLIDSVQIVDQDNLTVTLKSAQTGFVQVFDPDLILATESGATIGNTSNNYAFAYDTTTQDAGAEHATGSVTLTGGSSGSVDGITVNGIQIMSGSVPYTLSLEATAILVAANIGNYTSTPNYSASAKSGVVTIYAVDSGTGPNGFSVVSSTTTITTTDANMSGGTAATINSYAPIFFSNTENDGWQHYPNSPLFICATDSQYSVTIGLNIEKPGGGSPVASVVSFLNGSEILGSQQGIDITSNNTTFSLSRAFLLNATAGDEFTIQFASSQDNVDIIPAPEPVGGITQVSATLSIVRLL